MLTAVSVVRRRRVGLRRTLSLTSGQLAPEHDTGVTTLSMGTAPASGSAAATPPSTHELGIFDAHAALALVHGTSGGESRQPAAAARPTVINNNRGFFEFSYSTWLLRGAAHDHTKAHGRDRQSAAPPRFVSTLVTDRHCETTVAQPLPGIENCNFLPLAETIVVFAPPELYMTATIARPGS